MVKVIIGNDHSSVEVKNRLVRWLVSQGFEVTNAGVDTEESIDYPDIAEKACRDFLKGDYDFGILLCGTGIGISISANKIKGIRCALIHDSFCARMAKKHNNANFIAFGGRVTYNEPIESMITTFHTAVFEGGRHRQRVEKMDRLGERGC
ncbi:MAG: ribose 5-phosphate isomerase B [Spirochaetales bacterium]|nr:ribose 5-phosphate isomerase B [Spirochaetales bacterium]